MRVGYLPGSPSSADMWGRLISLNTLDLPLLAEDPDGTWSTYVVWQKAPQDEQDVTFSTSI